MYTSIVLFIFIPLHIYITCGHGYFIINIPFHYFLILLGYGFLVSQTAMPFVYLSLFCLMLYDTFIHVHPASCIRVLFHFSSSCTRAWSFLHLTYISCTKALAFPSPFLTSVDKSITISSRSQTRCLCTMNL